MKAGDRGRGVIAVATSIPPKLSRQDCGHTLPEYQDLCVQSWTENGFRVTSVNHPEEIADLARCYPDVTFIPASRNASEWTGRKNPYIADLLLALKEADEPVLGIINSDLLFQPSVAWAQWLPSLVGQSMVVAHRHDTNSLINGALRLYYGLDCFFFDKTTALSALSDAMPYAMGVPWWDYWLPCVALLSNRGITVVDRPAIVHLTHKAGYSREVFYTFAQIFAASTIRRFEEAAGSQPDLITSAIPFLREIAESEPEESELDRLTAKFANFFIPAMRRNARKWPVLDTHPAQSNVRAPMWGNIFGRLEQRVAAGDALRMAKKLVKEERWSDAGPDLIAALDAVPGDLDALLMLGEIFFERGDLDASAVALSKAAELRPDQEFPLHMLGIVLGAAGKNEQALACFTRILSFAPAYQRAYTASGKTLWKLDRQDEAIAFLEQAAARNPDFSDVIELLGKFRGWIKSPMGKRLWHIFKQIRSSFTFRKSINSPNNSVASSLQPPPPSTKS
jgi:tetratricopeptide (TPR) repeat protein